MANSKHKTSNHRINDFVRFVMSVCIKQDIDKNGQLWEYCTNLDRFSSTSPSHKRLTKLQLWLSRYRQRKVLAELDERLLADIGCTLQQAKQEAAKPFWK